MVQERTGIPPAEVILQVLAAHNVEYIFSSPGSEWPPVWEALAKRQALEEPTPSYINTRHEEVAIGLAAGYAKCTGRLPAVLLHTTVGTLHASMALRAAYHEQVPMVVAAGESSSYGEDATADPGAQWLRALADVGGPARLAEPYVKWSATVPTVKTLPGMVQHACRIALTPPQGPTFLAIPMELMLHESHLLSVPETSFVPPRSYADPALVEEAAQLLVESRSPLIITEHAGRHPQTVSRLVELAEALAIPVVEAQTPEYLNFPRTHPLHLGFDAKPFLPEADVVLLLGVTAPWHPPSKGPGEKARVILADDDTTKADVPFWNYRADLQLAGTLDATLEALVSHIKALKTSRGAAERDIEERRARWHAEHNRQRAAWNDEAQALATQKPMDTRWVCQVLGQVLPQDAIVVEEVISHRPAMLRLTPRTQPGTYISAHHGGLGGGLSTALGVKFAQPERLVVCLIGDGALNYNPVVADLGFIQEYRTPLLIVVLDNRGYASQKSGTLRYYPNGWAVRTRVFHGADILPGPDYAGLARVFGGYGEQVEAPGDVRPALERALQEVHAGRLALVDLLLHPVEALGR